MPAKIRLRVRSGRGGCLLAIAGIVVLALGPVPPFGYGLGLLMLFAGGGWSSYHGCGACGARVHRHAEQCPSCGVALRPPPWGFL